MEEELGNWNDARSLFEWALQQFEPGTNERKQMLQAYEDMEQNAGNPAGASAVYQRSIREAFKLQDTAEKKEAADQIIAKSLKDTVEDDAGKVDEKKLKEYDVMKWAQGSDGMKAQTMESEVWMNNGSIEGKVPAATMKKKRNKKQESNSEVR